MTLRRLVIGAVALVLAVLGVIPAAQAHDYLVGSTPKLNSTVTTAPKQVSLEFNDIVLTRPAPPQLTVRGPDGRYYETGCATVTDTTVKVPVALGGAGKYTVTWRVVSADGHPVSDSISFTYRPKAGVTGAQGIRSQKQCTAKAASTGSAAAPADTSSGGGTPTAAIVAVVAIVVIGVGGAALIVLTRGRRGHEEMIEDDDED
ncbi:MAG TPA: copper resistance CopC family protein [Flexivirga sp.]|uniref:copper resistance CopC family protein n=1 Tax=Flexivirga sp. TaxID=1962927 RepID=UPI002D0BA255|nr:copper resistance CopC family protein [Flexivirga sp.]HWC24747.1 copper resistance CopC family protein [Flexivirga sp.]